MLSNICSQDSPWLRMPDARRRDLHRQCTGAASDGRQFVQCGCWCHDPASELRQRVFAEGDYVQLT